MRQEVVKEPNTLMMAAGDIQSFMDMSARSCLDSSGSWQWPHKSFLRSNLKEQHRMLRQSAWKCTKLLWKKEPVVIELRKPGTKLPSYGSCLSTLFCFPSPTSWRCRHLPRRSSHTPTTSSHFLGNWIEVRLSSHMVLCKKQAWHYILILLILLHAAISIATRS